MFVCDASVAIRIASSRELPRQLQGEDPVAPPLMWSETSSVIRRSVWRGAMSLERGLEMVAFLAGGVIEERVDPELRSKAWEIAEELGWAKTYDAEYVALASLLGCRLVTLDGRLRRGADRLGFVVTPEEL